METFCLQVFVTVSRFQLIKYGKDEVRRNDTVVSFGDMKNGIDT